MTCTERPELVHMSCECQESLLTPVLLLFVRASLQQMHCQHHHCADHVWRDLTYAKGSTSHLCLRLQCRLQLAAWRIASNAL